MMPRVFWHYLGALYLLFQSMIAALWWLIIAVEPRLRPLFRPSDAPDSVLMAFFLPDAVLFIGAGLWAAQMLFKRPQKALLPLALHTGAAVYAALFCLAQWISTGEAILAAFAMAPCLVVQPYLLWKLSSRD
ncbi:MAG TPA: hypothetical protein VF627_02505 [Abditibacterium sp.]|jgi:hypothetical protein